MDFRLLRNPKACHDGVNLNPEQRLDFALVGVCWKTFGIMLDPGGRGKKLAMLPPLSGNPHKDCSLDGNCASTFSSARVRAAGNPRDPRVRIDKPCDFPAVHSVI